MPKKILGGKEILVDEDGFIQEPAKWDTQVAEDIAEEEASQSPMTKDMWKVVEFIREFYLENGIAPPIRMLLRKTGFSLEEIYQMFPKGPAAGACKIAGLPRSIGCI